jgi:hypothetical protein
MRLPAGSMYSRPERNLHPPWSSWVALIPQAARILASSNAVLRAAAESARADTLFETGGQNADMEFQATLVTYGDAPGYRDVSFTFDLQAIGSGPKKTQRVSLRIDPHDGERMVQHLVEVHRFAWRGGKTPLDAKPGERRPDWISNNRDNPSNRA